MALGLIVFDCDGVILESMDLKGKAFYRLGLRFGEEAADALVVYHHLHGGVSRFRKFEWLYETYAGRTAGEDELQALNKEFVGLVYEEMERCELVPGVQEVLDAWKGRVPLYVASGAPEEEVRTILEKRGLARYFEGIFGAPTVKSQLLRTIVQHLGVNPSDALMVGDARADQYAAEAVGVRFYGRGEYFRNSGHPWHEDLTALNAFLREMADEGKVVTP